MLTIKEKLTEPTSTSLSLTLPFSKRQKSRLKIFLDDNQEAALMLERGSVLRQGDFLRADNGLIIEVRAADEEVVLFATPDHFLLARACYHLGNRHIPVQIGEGWIRIQRDHVLEDMIRSLGLSVKHELAPFEPEGGAYGGHSAHSHSHHGET